MSEIRSTIDLIMERTTGMSLSAEEKEGLRRDDLKKRARGFRLKLLQAPSQAEEILAQVDAEPSDNRPILVSLIWESIVEGMMGEAEPLKSIQLLERLPLADKKKAVLGAFRAAVNAAIRQKSKDHKKMIAREKKKLAAFGISGSAVVPRVPRSSFTRAALAEVLAEYRDKLVKDLQA